MAVEDIDNIVIPSDAGSSTCGYCSPPGQRSEHQSSYHSATLEAIKISCSVYQRMIDRGWRRSGTYCYKPNLKRSCCPQYTIRLDAMEFKLSRSQRKLINRWNRFVVFGESDASAMEVERSSKPPASKSSGKVKKSPPFTTLSAAIHESEKGFLSEGERAHTFEVILEPSSYTPEKFALYKKYQMDVHQDKRNTPYGFKRFLVDSPLQPEPIPYLSPPSSHLPRTYGSYHQLYRLDGQLIAMGVIDILPNCVSSVYFMYDIGWERFSLGKISALREASLAREMRDAGALEMGYLYMGFYIYSCQKMRYKGDYAPSYLADPETYQWFPLERCIPLLEKNRYACFSEPLHSNNETIEPGTEESRWWALLTHPYFGLNKISSKAALEGAEPLAADSKEFDGIHMLVRDETGDIITRSIKETGYLAKERVRDTLGTSIRGLGREVAKEVAFAM